MYKIKLFTTLRLGPKELEHTFFKNWSEDKVPTSPFYAKDGSYQGCTIIPPESDLITIELSEEIRYESRVKKVDAKDGTLLIEIEEIVILENELRKSDLSANNVAQILCEEGGWRLEESET